MSLVSICIPTRNRAEFLDYLLGEIAKFERLNYEVVISDNNSDDDTATVVMRWRTELKNVYYLRQKSMISGPENACAVCNAARGDYIFRISDDDLVVEEGLLAAQAILDESPNSIAVYPRWHICNATFDQIHTVVHYGSEDPLIRNNTDRLEDATAHLPIRVTRDQALEMYERFWTVELPVFRRDIFQRHIGFVSNQQPLDFYAAAHFLKYGDIYFIWELCAKIRQHSEQDSKSLHSPRVLEAYASDYEQFLGYIPDLDPMDAMRAFYGKMIRQYVISSQFAVDSGEHLRALEIIRKALAFKVPGVEGFAREFERTHLTAIVATFIAQAVTVTPNARRLVLENCPDAQALLPHLHERLGSIPIALIEAATLSEMPISHGDFIVTDTPEIFDTRLNLEGANPARLRSLRDIYQACRIS